MYPFPAADAGQLPIQTSREKWRYVYPALGFLVINGVVLVLDLDQKIGDYLYAQQGFSWALREHWLTSDVLHTSGRALSVVASVLVLMVFLLSWVSQALRAWRRPAGYLFLSLITATSVIGLLKQGLGVPCPWDFARYGGDLAYVPLGEQLWLADGAGCFPAGHASAGYAWICAYFVAAKYRPSWRRFAFWVPLSVGAVFGVAQQLRGAHFFSHDLWSLAICWYVAALFSDWLLEQPSASVSTIPTETISYIPQGGE